MDVFLDKLVGTGGYILREQLNDLEKVEVAFLLPVALDEDIGDERYQALLEGLLGVLAAVVAQERGREQTYRGVKVRVVLVDHGDTLARVDSQDQLPQPLGEAVLVQPCQHVALLGLLHEVHQP